MVTFNYLPGKALPGTCAHRDQQIIEHSFFSFKIAALSSLRLFTNSREGTESRKTTLLQPPVHFPNLVFHFIAVVAVAVIYIIIVNIIIIIIIIVNIIIVSITKCLNMIGS